jgi:hypothetical protein
MIASYIVIYISNVYDDHAHPIVTQTSFDLEEAPYSLIQNIDYLQEYIHLF